MIILAIRKVLQAAQFMLLFFVQLSGMKKTAVFSDGGSLQFLTGKYLCAVFPGGQFKVSAESAVKGGVVPVTNLLAYLLQRPILGDQFLRHLHTALGNKIMKCHGCPFLEQLGHRGYTDTAMGRDHFQGDLFRQIGIHIGRDLIQQSAFSHTGAWAFLTSL